MALTETASGSKFVKGYVIQASQLADEFICLSLFLLNIGKMFILFFLSQPLSYLTKAKVFFLLKGVLLLGFGGWVFFVVVLLISNGGGNQRKLN